MKLGKNLNIRKQFIGESTLYFLVWVLVFIAPFMNAGLMSEEIANPRVSLLALLKILPFMFLFLLNHLVLFRYLHRGKWSWLYYVVVLTLIVFLFSMIEVYEQQNSIKPDFKVLFTPFPLSASPLLSQSFSDTHTRCALTPPRG